MLSLRAWIMVGDRMKEQIITLNQTIAWNEPFCACIGYFDGMHVGHQQLLAETMKQANIWNAKAALISFDPDPWQVVRKMHQIPHLMSLKQRKEAAQAMGIELWITLDFTAEMAALEVAQFHEQILHPLPLRHLVCGFDFHYAYQGKGNIHTLQNQSFGLSVIDEVSSDFAKISSTRIEQCIMHGDMEKSAELLSRPYQMQGHVVHGLQNGRRIGFPTANLAGDTLYVQPKEGVYVGLVDVDSMRYPAMINVGSNPTIQAGQSATIEAHILNFDGDLYDHHVCFHFLHYLRPDHKFSGLNALKQQLERDRIATLNYLKGRGMDAPTSI